jgi:hypothetical protein
MYCSMELEMLIVTAVSVHMGNRSAVKRVEFIIDRMSCLILSGRWCNIVLNAMHQLGLKVVI